MTDTVLAPPRATFRTWAGYGALCVGMFMAILDIQIVVTSLPAIEEALRIGADRRSWIQTAYLIAEVIAIPLTGLFTRIFSLRWLFCGAIAIFTLASVGCATSSGFGDLIAWRIVQGLSGGVLIPLVFSANFLLFPRGLQQTVATTMGGILAVLAPALGPIGGGLITESFSWHWLFLINLGPGIAALAVGLLCLPRAGLRLGMLRLLDWTSLAMIAAGLAALEIGLKEAPERGWVSTVVLGLFVATAVCLALAARRPAGVVDFGLLRDRNLAFGCAVSFALGVGLFGSVYLMPVFLAFVRHHGPVDIGMIVLVTGVAQLVTAPLAVLIDRKVGARLLSFIGFACFSAGLAMSAGQTPATDYDEMFWPQVVRGCFIAFCILPPTRFALGLLPLSKVADASGLYNLSRNLGGAIGIALIDTIIFARSPEHADRLTDLIRDDPAAAAAQLLLTPDDIPAPDDAMGLLSIMEDIQAASLTLAINEAWAMLAGITALALVILTFMGPIRSVAAASSEGS